MYICWSLCTLYLHACQVRVTTGDSGLCCCTCVMYFECWLTPLWVDSAWALWASCFFRFVLIFFRLTKRKTLLKEDQITMRMILMLVIEIKTSKRTKSMLILIRHYKMWALKKKIVCENTFFKQQTDNIVSKYDQNEIWSTWLSVGREVLGVNASIWLTYLKWPWCNEQQIMQKRGGATNWGWSGKLVMVIVICCYRKASVQH